MIRALLRPVLVLALLLLATGTATSQGKFGEAAPDFPPGTFIDGRSYNLADYEGKVVVLFFFEPKCPRCKGTIPERNAVVKAMKGKPVQFLAIAANVGQAEAAAYQQQTQLAMPVFADSLGVMQKRYGQQISLQNIWQFRVVAPDGKVVGYEMTKEALDKALDKVKVEWKYKEGGYDAKLDAVVDAFEWGNYAQGLKTLAPFRKSLNKNLAESAGKLYEAVKTQGEAWKAEAEGLVESEPVKAYDLYVKISTAFAGDELGKSVAEPLKKLAANKAVLAELAARKAFTQYTASAAKMTPAQKPAAIKLLQDIIKKHKDTPTADKAATLAKELGE